MSTVALPSPATTASTLRIAVVGTAFSFLWSSAFVAGKIGLTSTGPLTLLSLRFLLAGVLLALLRPLVDPSPLLKQAAERRAILTAMAAGLLTNAVYLGLTYSAMRALPAGLVAILVSVSPLLTSALAALWLKEPFGWRGAAGLAAGFLGVVWTMGGRMGTAPVDFSGVALVLAGTVALAASTLLNRRVVGRLDLWSISLIQLPISGLVLLPLAWHLEGLAIRPDAAFFGSLIYQALMVSIGTTLMLLWLVRHGGAAKASSFHLANPVFATMLAIGILGEHVSLSDLIGIVPIVAGLALVLRPGR